MSRLMRRSAARLFGLTGVLGIAAAAAALAIAACQQGEGEYCQLDRDCSSGLICNKGTQLCQTPSSVIVDGGEIDAAVDANLTDAGTDGPTDAAVDAAPDA